MVAPKHLREKHQVLLELKESYENQYYRLRLMRFGFKEGTRAWKFLTKNMELDKEMSRLAYERSVLLSIG